jgi:hypothetical protein
VEELPLTAAECNDAAYASGNRHTRPLRGHIVAVLCWHKAAALLFSLLIVTLSHNKRREKRFRRLQRDAARRI